jgi:hypothetical protein
MTRIAALIAAAAMVAQAPAWGLGERNRLSLSQEARDAD